MANKGIALHIGVNKVDPDHYAGWSGPLKACEADADTLMDIAASQGFECRLLKTADATRSAVITGIEEAATSLEAGDIFLVSYAGHGGQVPDEGGDEADLADETWCLYDGQLVDDELHVLWSAFARGVRILVISDSCHSGSVTRAPVSMGEAVSLTSGPMAEAFGTVGAEYRFMPDDAAARTYRENRAFYDQIQARLPLQPSAVRATVRLISGCQDHQLSLDGAFNGLFTGQLRRVWISGRFQGSYADFHHQIEQRMPASQTPNHLVFGEPNPDFDRQRPFTI